MQWLPYQILTSIANRLKKNVYMEPIVLKSMCFLYAVLNGFDQFPHLSNVLLKNLEYWPKLLTYHPKQLFWILKRGSSYLKMKILTEWIHNTSTDIVIFGALHASKSETILIEYILSEEDYKSKQRFVCDCFDS